MFYNLLNKSWTKKYDIKLKMSQCSTMFHHNFSLKIQLETIWLIFIFIAYASIFRWLQQYVLVNNLAFIPKNTVNSYKKIANFVQFSFFFTKNSTKINFFKHFFEFMVVAGNRFSLMCCALQHLCTIWKKVKSMTEANTDFFQANFDCENRNY